MPHLFRIGSHDDEDVLQETGEDLPHKNPRRTSLFKNIGGFWKRHHDQREAGLPPPVEPLAVDDSAIIHIPSVPSNATSTRAIPSLPRPQTFRRQNSERRERLLEVPPSPSEKRTLSVDRRRGLSASAAGRPLSPKPFPLPHVSAPDIIPSNQIPSPLDGEHLPSYDEDEKSRKAPDLPPLQILDKTDCELEDADDDHDDDDDQHSLQEEYDRSWILNLSMHFRDKSNREKFFVTYAEIANKWRRVTVSLDYRNAPEGSLEADLSTLHYQRDKSFRIFEAIRESLPDIQYYNTVTNLKLETTPDDGQLHIHVREDANEIIQYPSTTLFDHVRVVRYRESELEFLTHLSGFVYKVRVDGSILIKKEIPGPDNIDEFLYEVNALDCLLGTSHVVQLEGLVTDESKDVVKGLLISYASNGALIDMLYDFRNTNELPWHRREKWAMQIVEGLADIHEAGFVQGDFTLSNIVIDHNDDAQIIDINRRGCPVGWEPPELGRLIDSGQRIGMCIGVKTDLFQLGMVLWALAEEVDEPERVERPLPPVIDEIPAYFGRMVQTCLSERPQGRAGAKNLLRHFPPTAGLPPPPGRNSVDFEEDIRLSDHSVSTHRSDKEYIDPDMAVTLEDVNPRNRRREVDHTPITSGQVSYVDPRDPDSNPESSSYRFESSGSWVVGHRGRSPISSRRRRSSPFARQASSSATSLSRSPPSRGPRRRGSDCSSAEPISSSRHRSEKETEDGEASAVATSADNDPEPDPKTTADDILEPLPQVKRLTAVQGEELVQRSPLLHTDSGFDEQMVEELDLGPSDTSPSLNTSAQPSGYGCAFVDGTSSEKHGSTPTLGSFYTPMATPGVEFAKCLLGNDQQQDHEDQQDIMTTRQDHERAAVQLP